MMRIKGIVNAEAVNKEIANRIKQHRISAEITQKELADKSMVSLKTISRFENGEEIGFINLIKILIALDLSDNLDLLVPDYTERPSFYDESREHRQRASKKKKDDKVWKWGDEK